MAVNLLNQAFCSYLLNHQSLGRGKPIGEKKFNFIHCIFI